MPKCAHHEIVTFISVSAHSWSDNCKSFLSFRLSFQRHIAQKPDNRLLFCKSLELGAWQIVVVEL